MCFITCNMSLVLELNYLILSYLSYYLVNRLYILKVKMVLKTLPCGIPLTTLRDSDLTPFNSTYCVLLLNSV